MLKKIIATIMVIFLIFTNVNAIAVTDEKKMVDTNKAWTIKFNQEVILDNEAITVIDSAGQLVKISLTLGQDASSILVNPPSGGYTKGENYKLKVGNTIKSKTNKYLAEAVELNFSIKLQDGNFIPSTSDKLYKSSSGYENLVELYQLNWYEAPTRQISKGEFMSIQLRTLQEAIDRKNASKVTGDKDTLNSDVISTLTASTNQINDPIKKFEVANVLASLNSKILKIPVIKITQPFDDTKGHAAQKNMMISYQIGLLNSISTTKFSPESPFTLEQTLQMLENEIGFYGILRTDISKAMNKTFNVTTDTNISNSISSNKAYVKYEEKMNTYGLDKYYENQSSKSSEIVKNIEAIKLATAIALRTNNPAKYFGTGSGYKDEAWVICMKYYKFISEDINDSNYMNKVKYIDVISYFEKGKMAEFSTLPIKDTQVNLKDIDKYTTEEQKAIKDMVANEIIRPISDSLNGNEYITKGQLNELVVNFVERYDTIVKKGEKIQLDPEKMPVNAYLFPFILTNVDKSVYDIPLMIEQGNFTSPKAFYQRHPFDYTEINERTEGFFNTVLNIDYRTITAASLSENLSKYTIRKYEDVEKYVKYVKDNEIVIEGKAEFQAPIVYKDDASNRYRIRLQFEIKHSKTKNNVLCLDRFGVVTYAKTSYDILSDNYLDIPFNALTFFPGDCELFYTIVNVKTSGITRIYVD